MCVPAFAAVAHNTNIHYSKWKHIKIAYRQMAGRGKQNNNIECACACAHHCLCYAVCFVCCVLSNAIYVYSRNHPSPHSHREMRCATGFCDCCYSMWNLNMDSRRSHSLAHNCGNSFFRFFRYYFYSKLNKYLDHFGMYRCRKKITKYSNRVARASALSFDMHFKLLLFCAFFSRCRRCCRCCG